MLKALIFKTNSVAITLTPQHHAIAIAARPLMPP
jgi:hypothetical protein